MESEDEDDLVFMEEEDFGEGDGLASPPPPRPWPVLIVDDDEEVHSVTRLALDSFTFRGRPLAFSSAYSAVEAMALLETLEEVAVILLDVVMETDDAGLRVVRFTRDRLANQTTRIILRTGQPGQAPEHDLIVDYDINDYKSKTELTLSKLYTMMVSSLRSFEQIRALQSHRLALRRLLGAAAQTFKAPEATVFSDILLERIAIQLDRPVTGALCLREGESGESAPRVLASWGDLGSIAVMGDPREGLGQATWDRLRTLPPTTETAHSLGGAHVGVRVESPADGHPISLVLTTDGDLPPLSEADTLVLRLFCETIADHLGDRSPVGPD
ncbi:MAG: DUF3369 domain-containing protein, partial [Rhodospirillum sp.]|nr:DUF3369 domain-containing protein [Rhodospirillum sp.]